MSTRNVLAVAVSDDEATRLEAALSDATVLRATPGTATVRLCRTAVGCLVVPAAIGARRARRLAGAARQLYPGLPVVVYGPAVASDGDLNTVEATDIGDAAVTEAVEAALAHETSAARDPTRAETLLGSLFEELPVHLFAKDRAGRHVLSSDSLVDPDDVIGFADDEIHDEELEVFREAIYADDRRVIDEGVTLTDVEEYSRKHDSHVLTSKVPWRDSDDEILGLAGITREVTEQKRREERYRASNERLRRVALKAAHELRNELQVATGRLELAENDSRILAEVALSHRRLAEIIDDVVQLAHRSETNQERSEIRLSAVVREVWETTTTGEMTLSVTDDAVFVGEPDSTRLLVETLISNALEHGGERCTVSVGVTPAGFYLEDDGPGIVADPAERVFEAGYSAVTGSSGFGLYIASRIAADNGWEIVASESADGGARFELGGVTFRD